MSTTHFAGHIVGVNGRLIQRCSVCGLKLADNRNYPLNADGTVAELPAWEPGHLVRQEGDPPVWIDLGRVSDNVPEDFCIELVEE